MDHLWGCLDRRSKKEKREKDKHDPQSSLRFCPRFNALALYTRIMFVQWESGASHCAGQGNSWLEIVHYCTLSLSDIWVTRQIIITNSQWSIHRLSRWVTN